LRFQWQPHREDEVRVCRLIEGAGVLVPGGDVRVTGVHRDQAALDPVLLEPFIV
jgi:hypothetical protein